MQNKKLIVFDMDGVIMDVSGSYRDVVRQTTKLFFSPARGSDKLLEPLFELSDLAAVKQSGGLNNDWDLTCVVINLLFSLVDQPVSHGNRDPWTFYRETIGRCEVSRMAEFLRSTDRPLTSLVKQRGPLENEIIAGLYEGDVGSGNVIKQIFQEIYLGSELFKATYNIDPVIYKDKGYILREKVLIDRQILDDLSKANVFAIATGRPQAEADYPLDHFDLKKYFKIIYTLDDCLSEEIKILKSQGMKVSLSKPHPFMLDAIAERQNEVVSGLYYVGDMPDDMLAAARSRYGFKSIGVLVSAPDKSSLEKELIRAGADFIIKDFEGLKRIIDNEEISYKTT